MYWEPRDRTTTVENQGCVGIVVALFVTLALGLLILLGLRLLGWF